jgi:proteasome lid subunit RPN8/RPN11
VRIEAALLERILAHARRDFPNECCGMIAMHEDDAVAIHEATNVAASPLRFEVDGREIIEAQDAFEAEGA